LCINYRRYPPASGFRVLSFICQRSLKGAPALICFFCCIQGVFLSLNHDSKSSFSDYSYVRLVSHLCRRIVGAIYPQTVHQISDISPKDSPQCPHFASPLCNLSPDCRGDLPSNDVPNSGNLFKPCTVNHGFLGLDRIICVFFFLLFAGL